MFDVVIDVDFGDHFVALSPISATPCSSLITLNNTGDQKYIAGVKDIGDEAVPTIAALFMKVKKLVTLSL